VGGVGRGDQRGRRNLRVMSEGLADVLRRDGDNDIAVGRTAQHGMKVLRACVMCWTSAPQLLGSVYDRSC